MDFTIYNSFDGTSQSVTSGSVVHLNVGPGAEITIEQLQAYPTSAGLTTITNSGSALQSASAGYIPSTFGSPPVAYQMAVAVFSLTTGLADGTYHAGLTFLNTILQTLSLILNVGSAPDGSAPLAGTLPDDTLDFFVDLLRRKVTSTLLPQIDGFKATDNLKFAVVPSRGGTFIASGISQIQLSLRPVGKFSCQPLVAATLSSPSVTGSSPNQYYALNFSLDQTALTRWFEAANQAAADAATSSSSGSGSSSSTTSSTPPSGLMVAGEFQFTESGSVVTTSDTFTFVIFQSIVTPSPTF